MAPSALSQLSMCPPTATYSPGFVVPGSSISTLRLSESGYSVASMYIVTVTICPLSTMRCICVASSIETASAGERVRVLSSQRAECCRYTTRVHVNRSHAPAPAATAATSDPPVCGV